MAPVEGLPDHSSGLLDAAAVPSHPDRDHVVIPTGRDVRQIGVTQLRVCHHAEFLIEDTGCE